MELGVEVEIRPPAIKLSESSLTVKKGRWKRRLRPGHFALAKAGVATQSHHPDEPKKRSSSFNYN